MARKLQRAITLIVSTLGVISFFSQETKAQVIDLLVHHHHHPGKSQNRTEKFIQEDMGSEHLSKGPTWERRSVEHLFTNLIGKHSDNLYCALFLR